MSEEDTAAVEQADEEFDQESWDDRLDALKRTYGFYIMNPEHEKGVEYSLWHQGERGEFPILSSNTGGFVTFNSRSESVGDALELSDEFFELVGWGFHEAMCFMPDIYFRGEHFERTADSIYDGKPRKHEVWAAQVLIHWMATPGQMVPELRPLVEWADNLTEFGVPRLGGEPDAE